MSPPIAGVPAGAPAGSPANTGGKGNKAGEVRTISGTIGLDGVPAGRQNNLGTVPVADGAADHKGAAPGGTLRSDYVVIDSVRIVARKFESTPAANAPDGGTFQVIANVGHPTEQVDILDTRNQTLPGNASSVSGASVANRNGAIRIDGPGATLEVNPVGANKLAGRKPHSFHIAQQGGTIHSGTLDVQIDVRPGG